MDPASHPDVEEIRERLRTVLRDTNGLIDGIETHGLPDGTHALATALRQRIDDLASAIDVVVRPVALGLPRRPVGDLAAPVDEGALDALIAEAGDPAPVVVLVQQLLADLHTYRQALNGAVDAYDLAAAHAVAHELRPGAQRLGAADLAHACELLIVNDQPSRLRAVADHLLTQATATARWLQVWLANQHT